MNDDRLDPLLHALRSPARAAELRGESEAVESMMSALATTTVQEAPTMFRRSAHRTRVAALVAAGVIGFAGVAAAGPGGFARSTPAASVSEFDEELEELEATDAEGEDEGEDEGDGEDTGQDADTAEGDGGDTGTDEDDVVDATPENDDQPELAAADTDEETDGDDEADDGPMVCEGYDSHGDRVSAAATALPGGPDKGRTISMIATDRDCSVDVPGLLAELEEGADESEDADEDRPGNRPDHAGPPANPGRPADVGGGDDAEESEEVDATDDESEETDEGSGRPDDVGPPEGTGRPDGVGRPDRD
jgi:hypothetical protein